MVCGWGVHQGFTPSHHTGGSHPRLNYDTATRFGYRRLIEPTIQTNTTTEEHKQQFNKSPNQQFNKSTIQQFNNSTIQQFNQSTNQQINKSANVMLPKRY